MQPLEPPHPYWAFHNHSDEHLNLLFVLPVSPAHTPSPPRHWPGHNHDHDHPPPSSSHPYLTSPTVHHSQLPSYPAAFDSGYFSPSEAVSRFSSSPAASATAARGRLRVVNTTPPPSPPPAVPSTTTEVVGEDEEEEEEDHHPPSLAHPNLISSRSSLRSSWSSSSSSSSSSEDPHSTADPTSLNIDNNPQAASQQQAPKKAGICKRILQRTRNYIGTALASVAATATGKKLHSTTAEEEAAAGGKKSEQKKKKGKKEGPVHLTPVKVRFPLD